MRLSKGARITLIVLGVLVLLAAVVARGIESEYGGNEAVEGLAKGYLPDGVVEVREVDWGRGPEAANDYEVTVARDSATIHLVDAGGLILFRGTVDEADSWLDDQGLQVYVGTNAGADDYLAGLRSDATSHTASLVLGVIAIPILIVAALPAPTADMRNTGQPAAPLT